LLVSLASPIAASKIRPAFPANFTVAQLTDNYFGPAQIGVASPGLPHGSKLLCARPDKKR
jgi:hypothetical protein